MKAPVVAQVASVDPDASRPERHVAKQEPPTVTFSHAVASMPKPAGKFSVQLFAAQSGTAPRKTPVQFHTDGVPW